MSEELKPCPFCGGEEIEILTSGNNYTKKRSATVRCKNGCNVKITVAALRFDIEWCKEKLIERWNTRPIEEELKAENERLRQVIKKASTEIYDINEKVNAERAYELRGISIELDKAVLREVKDGE